MAQAGRRFDEALESNKGSYEGAGKDRERDAAKALDNLKFRLNEISEWHRQALRAASEEYKHCLFMATGRAVR